MLTTVAAGRVFDYSYCIGMYGMSGQGFWAPQDFVLGEGNLIYVVSRGVEEIGQRITRVTRDHEFLGQFGAAGRGDGQFVWPRSIDLDSVETSSHLMIFCTAYRYSTKKARSCRLGALPAAEKVS